MTKRHWFYLTGGIVALTVIASALLWLNSSKQYQKANILQHIASRTSCLIKIEELTSYMAAMDTLAYAHEFESVFFAETDTSVRQHIIAEIAKQPNLRNFIQRPIYISYHSTKDSAKQNALITIKLNKQAEKKALESIASTLQNEKLSIAGNSIHKFNIARGKTLYGSISKGILYLSQSIELINQSINLPVDESLSADTQFMELFRTMSTTMPVSMIIQPAKAGMAKQMLTNRDEANENLIKQAKWIELDISFKKTHIQSNGLLLPQKNSFTDLVLKNAPSLAVTLDSVIPSNAIQYTHFSNDRRGLANEHYAEYLKINGLYAGYNAIKEKIAGVAGFDVESQLSELFHTEMVSYEAIINGRTESCLVLAVADSSRSMEQIKNVFAHKKISRLIKPHKNLTITCFQTATEHKDLLFLDNYFPEVAINYYCYYNGTILMATSAEIIEQNIINRIQNNTLHRNSQYLKVRQQLSANQQFSYVRSGLIPGKLKTALSMEESTTIEALKRFGESAVQLSTIQNMMYLSMSVQYAPERKEEPDFVWQIRPDTILDKGPIRVLNHRTKEDEIVFTDKNNNLYLADNKGIILWKRPIRQNIIGEISQLDYFRNGKLQYLFNDAGYIYLIDRNGEDVAPFPIKLPMKTTNAVTCFDYEHDGNFRFAFAGEDRRVYMLGRNGERIEGFDAPTANQAITTPIQHFRSAGKDYIVFHDDKMIYITDRKGARRVLPDSTAAPNSQSIFYLIEKDQKEASLITSTTKNEWMRIYLASGKTELKSIFFDGDQKHQFLHLPTQDRFVMLLSSKILIMNKNGDMELSTESGSNQIAEAKVVINTNAQELISYTDTLPQKTFLTDGNGIALSGFPIKAKSTVVIIKSGQNPTEILEVFNNSDNIISARKKAE